MSLFDLPDERLNECVYWENELIFNRRKLTLVKNICCVLSIVVMQLGCGSTHHYVVVSREVPESPTFTVVPANFQMKEVTFARDVESAIIAAGVKVARYSPPAATEVTKEATLGENKSAKIFETYDNEAEARAAGKSGSARVTKTYFELEGGTRADYYVETYAYRRQIKISNGKEVLTVFDAKPLGGIERVAIGNVTVSTNAWQLKMHAVLSNMGIPVTSFESYAQIYTTRPATRPARRKPTRSDRIRR